MKKAILTLTIILSFMMITSCSKDDEINDKEMTDKYVTPEIPSDAMFKPLRVKKGDEKNMHVLMTCNSMMSDAFEWDIKIYFTDGYVFSSVAKDEYVPNKSIPMRKYGNGVPYKITYKLRPTNIVPDSMNMVYKIVADTDNGSIKYVVLDGMFTTLNRTDYFEYYD